MRNKLETSVVLKVSSGPWSFRLRENIECVFHTLMLSSGTRVRGSLAQIELSAASSSPQRCQRGGGDPSSSSSQRGQHLDTSLTSH